MNNSNVHIIIGFGKNENNINRSFKKEDFDYFLQFPNVTIVYIQIYTQNIMEMKTNL